MRNPMMAADHRKDKCMIFSSEGIVFVGMRNQQPTVNWPGVLAGTAVCASLIAASSCCFWYLLTGALIPWPQLLW